MRHPIEKYNQQQAAMLAELPESERAYMARFFRIGNATYRYYQRARELAVFTRTVDADVAAPSDSVAALVAWLKQQIEQANDPEGTRLAVESRSARELLTVYFEEFLAGLPHEGLRRRMKEEGIDQATRSIPFLRYLLERHDIGMDDYLRQHLSEEDYAFHLENGKPL